MQLSRVFANTAFSQKFYLVYEFFLGAGIHRIANQADTNYHSRERLDWTATPSLEGVTLLLLFITFGTGEHDELIEFRKVLFGLRG
jgi:hypothetical protein